MDTPPVSQEINASSLTEITETWLSRKPRENAGLMALTQALVLFGLGLIYINGKYNSAKWMAVTGESIFQNHELWRLWTSLFAHADMGHLISNASLYIPLTFLLSGYFGVFVFPLLGLFLGGFINFLVIQTLPMTTPLIGMSGVVHWMGAMWLTLFLLIDRRKSLKRRFAGSLFVALVLFAPETYKPEVSYLSHVIGFATGILSAGLFYLVKRKEFLQAEVSLNRWEENREEGPENPAHSQPFIQ